MPEKRMIDRNPMVNFTEVNTQTTTRRFYDCTTSKPQLTELYELCVPSESLHLLIAIEAHAELIENGDGAWTRYLTNDGLSYTHADFDQVNDLQQRLIAAWWEIKKVKDQALANLRARSERLAIACAESRVTCSGCDWQHYCEDTRQKKAAERLNHWH